MERIGNSGRSGNQNADRVRPCRGHVHCVAEPLSRGRPAEIVAGCGGCCRLQIDAVGAVAVGRSIDRGHVIGDSLAAGVVVLGHHRARNRRGRSAERSFAAAIQRERHRVDVPAGCVLVHCQRLRARGQCNSSCYRHPGLEAAGRWNCNRTAEVGSRRVGNMERIGNSGRSGNQNADRVRPCRGHVHCVAEPLSRGRPAEIVAGCGGCCRLQIDAVGAVAVGRSIDRGHVIGDSLAAGVVVLGHHRARNRRGRSAERSLGRQQAIDAQLAAVVGPCTEAAQIRLAVGDDGITVLGIVAAVVAGGVLLRIPEFAADIVGVESAKDAGYRAMVGIAAENTIRPKHAAAGGGAIGRNREHATRHAARGRRHGAGMNRRCVEG